MGELEGRTLAFLPRHGRGHRLAPSQINYRANIYAMKKLGVERDPVDLRRREHEGADPRRATSSSSTSSSTARRIRPNTFFGDGVVGHVTFADPVCPVLSAVASRGGPQGRRCASTAAARTSAWKGPQFSTRAESNIYRKWGVDVIGMTNLPEAKLAREAEICYATLALATDYDCWHEYAGRRLRRSDPRRPRRNAENSRRIVREVGATPSASGGCGCGEALKYAVITDRKMIPAAARKRLSLLLGKYL